MKDKKIELPGTPSEVATTFLNLCRSFPLEAIPQLTQAVSATVDKFDQTKDSYLGPDIHIVHLISEQINFLLDNYQNYSDEQQQLIVGAVRFFIIEKDCIPDYTPITGLDDDLKVLNYVLGQLGLQDRIISPAS